MGVNTKTIGNSDDPVGRFDGRTFKDTVVDLDGREFYNCTFINCGIRYSGSRPGITLDGCTFDRCHFVFDGYATNTVAFLSAIYNGMGDWGKGSVEKLFDEIRKKPKR